MSLEYLFQDQIPFELKRSKRKTLALHVYAEKVQIRAPLKLCEKKILTWVHQKQNWITQKWHYHQQQQTNTPTELHYLGTAITWKHTVSKVTMTHFENDTLKIYSPKSEQSTKLINAWYTKQAQAFFATRLKHCHAKFEQYKISLPPLKIRTMKSRWGSCSPSGTVTLNKKLIACETSCIDYVIIHELSHLIEFNHSKRFYEIMTNIMPDWKLHKKQLRFLPISINVTTA